MNSEQEQAKNIMDAFESSERWRINKEAIHCLDFYNLVERRAFLDSVEKWRGAVGRKCMEKAIIQEWELRNK